MTPMPRKTPSAPSFHRPYYFADLSEDFRRRKIGRNFFPKGTYDLAPEIDQAQRVRLARDIQPDAVPVAAARTQPHGSAPNRRRIFVALFEHAETQALVHD